MRVKSSILNISAGLVNQLIITLLSFFSRTVFIQILGVEYLGVNGLFTSILAMLSLAEAGIGSSIIYSLYKPVAENDQEKINVLIRLYKRAYLVIALIVLVLGLSIIPFLHLFVKNAEVEHIQLIYLLFLANTITPYLFQHKNSFLNVSQKSYIITGIYSISSIISMILKIVILYFTRNYILYLVIDSIITITNGVVLTLIVNKLYPFLKEKVSGELDTAIKSNIIRNIRAIILQNIGTYLIFSTDNIIISSFVSVLAVGLYSNYNMLIDICRTFINQVFNNVYYSLGNLVAKENTEKIYSVYKVYWLLNFWFYSFFAIFMYVIIEPFITLWIGSSFIMGKTVLIVLMITFYERGMRNAITTVKNTAGIFHEDRYVPLFQAVINLGFSILLVRYIGIAGVFIGTLISAMVVPFWTTPYFVYRKVFHKPLVLYFQTYFYYLAVGLATCLLTVLVTNQIVSHSVWTLGLKGLVAFTIPNIIYIVLFRKTEEIIYLLEIIKRTTGTLQMKLSNKKTAVKQNV